MRKYNFQQTGGFPLTTEVLEGVQHTASILEATARMTGNFSIISGLEVFGLIASDGVVMINGELLEFKSSVVQANIIIKEETSSAQFEDGTTKQISTYRYATFGSASVQYSFSNFKRVTNLNTIEERLDKLEKSLPKGLVAIWGKPADSIPMGWVEYLPLRGNVPVGHLPNDADFGTLDETLGEKKHQLTTDKLPKVNGVFQSIVRNSDIGSGIASYANSFTANIAGNPSDFQHAQVRINFGNDQAHNNIQPSRIVQYIMFVGF